jgi:hypothetical protein
MNIKNLVFTILLFLGVGANAATLYCDSMHGERNILTPFVNGKALYQGRWYPASLGPRSNDLNGTPFTWLTFSQNGFQWGLPCYAQPAP